MKPRPLENSELINMIHVLENDLKVKMIPPNYETHAVDNEYDLLKVESLKRDNVGKE
jgi:CMP-2-keto-3-deoxyoctulosonic acid synthetase